MGMRLPPDVEARCLALASQKAPTLQPEFTAEKQFQAWLMQEAKGRGWRAYHTHDSRKSVAGFPDTVLVRERVVWAELKLDGEEPSAAQLNWLEDLEAAGEEVYVWRPADVAEILDVLGDRRRTWRDWMISLGDRILIQSGCSAERPNGRNTWPNGKNASLAGRHLV